MELKLICLLSLGLHSISLPCGLYNRFMVVIFHYFFIIAITVTFGSPMYTAREESEQARPNIIFSNPSSFDITVQIMVTDNTAAGVNNTECTTSSPNNDYTMGLYDVTFNTMMIEYFLEIPVCNDIVLEENETFRLMIISDSLHPNVTIGDPSQVQVTIIDNDRKLNQRLYL